MWSEAIIFKIEKSFLSASFCFSLTDKTATTIESLVLAVYPLHIFSPHFLNHFRRGLVQNNMMRMGLLPIHCSSNEFREEHGKHDSDHLSI